MANNLEIEAQRQALVASIRLAAQSLRECANKTDDFANYLHNVFPVPQPYSVPQYALLPSGLAPSQGSDPVVAKRRPGRPKKVGPVDDDGALADDTALNGDGKKRKRQPKEKKIKDPNAPKRPPSAYLLYQNHVRKEVQAAHPNMPYSEILNEISRSWAQLSDEQKAPYSKATEMAKAEYEQKKSVYEAGLKVAEGAAMKPPMTAIAIDTPTISGPAPDTSDEDMPVQSPVLPVPVPAPAQARIVHMVNQDQVDVSITSQDEDEDEEDAEMAPPPKKRVRGATADQLLISKEKEKTQKGKEKEKEKEKPRKGLERKGGKKLRD